MAILFRSGLLWVFIFISVQLQSQSFEFALIGDMPYHPDDSVKFDRLIEDINEDTSIQWVMHTGDVKSGGSLCSDEYLHGRFNWYAQFQAPFIITPGDNEWTDCHRIAAGEYRPLERLAKFREIFYQNPTESLGQNKMPLQSQAELPGFEAYPENQRWEKNGVYFATMHIVGSLNGLAPFKGRTEANDKEVEARMDAAVHWLKETFELADANSKGVFLMIHANPGFEYRKDSTVARAFGPYMDALEAAIIRYGRPVILAHGDSHYFRIDKPLTHSTTYRRIELFTRLEAFGARDIHWVKVYVDPDDPQVFRIKQKLIPENFEKHQD